MIKTGKSIQEAFQKTVYGITRSKESLHSFLRQNTYLYKYPMNDILSIHSQNKEATYVASLDIWNRQERVVKKYSKAIRTLSDITNANSSKKYYFDIKQTVGKNIDIYDWSTSMDELPILLAEKHGDQSIHEDIYSYAQQMIDEMKVDGTEVAHEQLVALLTENSLLQKFNLPQEETFLKIAGEARKMDTVQFISAVKASNEVLNYTLHRLEPTHREIVLSRTKTMLETEVTEQKTLERVEKIADTSTEKVDNYSQEVLFPLEDEESKNNNVIPASSTVDPIGYSFLETEIYGKTKNEKISDNVAAVRLLKELEIGNRIPTQEEKYVLSKYVGWGGLSEVFDYRKENETYQAIREELQQLVTVDEYEQMEESVLTAYYTDPMIIEHIFQKVKTMGFQSGNVLDPAMGTGNFFSAMPQELKDNVSLTGVEIDSITGKIASYLHDDANVFIQPFQ
ncbi:helicase, partial [Enterococcus faecalis]|nr:helicase [Enterococcus faecalis]